MVELIKQQRHFLYLVTNTTANQRKALLETITSQQLRALSQIAYNIIRFKGKLTPTEKASFRCQRRFIYLLGDRNTGFVKKKKEAIQHNQRIIHTLVKIAFSYLQPVLQ